MYGPGIHIKEYQKELEEEKGTIISVCGYREFLLQVREDFSAMSKMLQIYGLQRL